jgi:hypothetical protein
MSKSNPHFDLIPKEFEKLKIGIAEYDEGPTGCTVFWFPEGAVTSVDVRGGMVGAIRPFIRIKSLVWLL